MTHTANLFPSLFLLLLSVKCQIIYHWSGSESNLFERLKTTEVAIAIRDNERSGRVDIEMIDEGFEPEDITDVSLFLFFFTFYSGNIWEYL